MKTIKINQFQSYYDMDDQKGVIVDFLSATMIFIGKGGKEINVIEKFIKEYEQAESQFNKRLSKIKNKNVEIVLIPSYNCNMNCIYCYEGGIKKAPYYFDKNNVNPLLRAIRTIMKNEKVKKLHFTLMGGEPIMKHNFDFCDPFFKQAKQEFGQFTILCISNGLEITDHMDQLLDYGIDSFQITIDGNEKKHNERRKPNINSINGFKKTSQSIDHILAKGLNLEIRVNIDSENLDSLPELSEYILKKGWLDKKCSIYLYPISENGCNRDVCYLPETDILKKIIEALNSCPEHYQIYNLRFHGCSFIDALLQNRLPIIHKYFCGANKNQYVFDPFGKVYTCWWGVSQEKYFKVGEIIGENYEINNIKVREWRNRNINTILKCVKCKFKYICGAGCSYKAISRTKSLYEPNCADFDKIFKIYLQYKLKNKTKENKRI
ncbi:radical SAM/SPASM domain-containing protein [Candidatus Atribacteria bacterium HGW-Atribacteria-1]|nr:MAG: radical SAM/SPASM domain-containing protein [Candidatus Atribacteria bacterium HGW-Atribacteria-1]